MGFRIRDAEDFRSSIRTPCLDALDPSCQPENLALPSRKCASGVGAERYWLSNPDGLGKRWRLTRPQVRRYLTSMKTTISSRGQIVLPADFRQMDRVEPGQEFDVERLDRGDYRFVRRAARQNDGAIDWLLACPRKGFFVPIDSESTDAL
jgi:hypothetical protein